THDIDEAVRLADRIAIFRQGGVLEQYDSPAAILGRPATSFVADFVGADRGLRRLAVTPIGRGDLEFPPVVALESRLADVAAALVAARGAAPFSRRSRWAAARPPGRRQPGSRRHTARGSRRMTANTGRSTAGT